MFAVVSGLSFCFRQDLKKVSNLWFEKVSSSSFSSPKVARADVCFSQLEILFKKIFCSVFWCTFFVWDLHVFRVLPTDVFEIVLHFLVDFFKLRWLRDARRRSEQLHI